MSEQTTIEISTVALTTTDKSVLKVAINLLNKSEFVASLLAENDLSGQIIIVDMDTEEGKKFYQNFNVNKSQVLLLLSHDVLQEHQHAIFRKPVRVQTLRDTLDDLSQEVLAKPLNTKEIQQSSKSSAKHVDLKDSLFFTLLQIHQNKTICQVFCHPHPALYVNAEQGIIATSASRKILREITHNYSHPIISKTISNSDFEILAKGQMILPLKNILWSAALFGSHGQLLEGNSDDVPVQLNAWPNLTRLDFTPEHLKLASNMAGQVTSLKDVIVKTQLSREVVIGFYNAALVTDLININPQKVLTTSKHEKTAKIGLFNKIASRLKLHY